MVLSYQASPVVGEAGAVSDTVMADPPPEPTSTQAEPSYIFNLSDVVLK